MSGYAPVSISSGTLEPDEEAPGIPESPLPHLRAIASRRACWAVVAASALLAPLVVGLMTLGFAQDAKRHTLQTSDGVEAKFEDQCHTAVEGEPCYESVQWAMFVGFKEHPEWYGNLTARSSVEEFQKVVHRMDPQVCPAPCKATRPVQEPGSAYDGPKCLCLFDIDRTLTGHQGWEAQCPKDQDIPGVTDAAYSGGELVLSDLAEGLSGTFCAPCLKGLISAGIATGDGSGERTKLMEVLGRTSKTLSDHWSTWPYVTSPLVLAAPDGHKQEVAQRILEWFSSAHQVTIAPGNVHFYDDIASNVLPFAGTGFNARQISCASRDSSTGGKIGGCGGLASEVVVDKGVVTCPGGAAWSM